jgi:amino acid transporter
LSLQAFSAAVWNASGHPEVTVRFRLLSTVTIVVGFAIAIALFADIVAVAVAFAVRSYLLLPLNLYWMRTYAGVPIRRQLREWRGVAAATTVMALCVVATKWALGPSMPPMVLLGIEVAAGAVAYLVALYFVERRLMRELVSFAADILPGRRRGRH